MGVQELHRAYRTPHAERTYHLHRVRPHVAERKRRTHGQSVRCECPHCHTTLKVETTLRRKFNDYEYLCIVTRCKGFQVLRFVYIECWAKVGQTPVYTHIEAVQRWIAPDGRSATFARLRPMGFFVHGWSWSSALELRAENDGKYNITPTRIYPRQRLIPELRRSGYGKQLPM